MKFQWVTCKSTFNLIASSNSSWDESSICYLSLFKQLVEGMDGFI